MMLLNQRLLKRRKCRTRKLPVDSYGIENHREHCAQRATRPEVRRVVCVTARVAVGRRSVVDVRERACV